MIRPRAVLLSLSLTLMLLPVATAANAPSDDEAAIRDVVRRVEAGWNAGSGEAFAAPFAEDADYVVINGDRIKGRQTNAARHQQSFDTIYKGRRNELTVDSVRFLRPDVAVAHVRAHLRFTRDGKPVEGNAISTWVLTKGPDGWSIAAFQNTGVRPPAPAPEKP
ncbi:MAG TPA: SgcJ/EcaC family oxidoreductase [Thermoanaerobaculia bacterium]|nr:SgcJ/EcaC family oxidoreductase [Thermoanaerobaculia bacterium]